MSLAINWLVSLETVIVCICVNGGMRFEYRCGFLCTDVQCRQLRLHRACTCLTLKWGIFLLMWWCWSSWQDGCSEYSFSQTVQVTWKAPDTCRLWAKHIIVKFILMMASALGNHVNLEHTNVAKANHYPCCITQEYAPAGKSSPREKVKLTCCMLTGQHATSCPSDSHIHRRVLQSVLKRGVNIKYDDMLN